MLALALLLAAQSIDAPVIAGGEADEGSLVILCDPKRSRLSIRADATSTDPSYPIRRVIPLASLVTMLPTSLGMPQYRGDLVRWEQCGPYSIRLNGDFYNANTGGEAGALPIFAAIRIVADNQWLYPDDRTLDRVREVRVTDCPRPETFPRVGDCSAGYASRIDITHADEPKQITIVETITTIDALDEGEPKTVTHRSFSKSVFF